MSEWPPTEPRHGGDGVAPGPNLGGPGGVSRPVIAAPAAPPPGHPVAVDVTPSGSFDALFDAHYERLVRALTLIGDDREAAADAVQDAFVKAHLRWRRIERYDDPIGWVRRVAINRLRDDHRRAGRARRLVERLSARPTEHVAAAADAAPDPDELGRLLAALPRQQRAAAALFYVDGLSVAEIAAALSLAEGTVKSHLHDARRRLRAVLEERGA